FSTRDEGRDENAPAGFRPAAPRTAVRRRDEQARSSGGEHYLDTVGVSGSNPLEPTNCSRRRRLAQLGERYLHTVEVNGSIPLAPTREEMTTRGNPRFRFLGPRTTETFGNRENMEALAEKVTIRLPDGSTLE